ncbi:MAG: DUF87 domain-containing protein, partial [Halobacteriales archaeon]
LPVLEVLTGRAFLTGKSGSGKSNSISVVAEKLLDSGFGLLIVDVEGEYYGLKEEYEILHAGADEECDIRVGEEHADKLASLALEQNVPIILDLSGFLEEGNAEALLTEVARHLFAKEKKLKQPFLMIVEEIHEYVPEGGGLSEVGRMLVKVAKRGRKHGLGIAGISQRPADVKKDFITQCDWLVWHRLTWQNDTRVVKRVLGSDYAEAVEDLNDGEGFLMTDWGEDVRKVQFYRKETFDAGATPGLEDFERPDLKSVSDDLVDELQEISQQEAKQDAEIGRLRNELEERERRIAELEEELAEARDLSRMAEQFARAMTAQVGQEYRAPDQTWLPEYAAEGSGANGDATGPADDGSAANGDATGPAGNRRPIEAAAALGDADAGEREDPATDPPVGHSLDDVSAAQRAIIEDAAAAHGTVGEALDDALADVGGADAAAADGPIDREIDSAERAGEAGGMARPEPSALAENLRERIAELDDCQQAILARYREVGIATPEAVHEAAGGSGDRAAAYRHNRALRKEGLVVHVGRGRYAYALPSLLEALADGLEDDRREGLLARAEAPLAE